MPQVHRTDSGYICIFDPSPLSPYAGGWLSRYQFIEILRYAYAPSGSVWKTGNEHWLVAGAENCSDERPRQPQQLVKLLNYRGRTH